jgi:ribosomal protein S18 acetylase RimI-like enzyme
MIIRALARDGEQTRQIAVALPWIHAAGQPYFDWLLGGRGAALRILEQWMQRPSSELFVGRVVLVEETHSVGGFIALAGAELAQCRLQDALAAAAATSSERHSALARRLRQGRALFPEVTADDFHLSRMGVLAEARRRGYGRMIVREFLENGTRRGFRRFTLDVSADNVAAIELYRSAGFREERRQQLHEAGMTYVRMALELST